MNQELPFDLTLKPTAVETPLDIRVLRPVAHVIVRLTMLTPLSAHALTAIGLATGLAGASLLRFPHQFWVVFGALLLFFAAILDLADGQLARTRGTASRFGRILDGTSGAIIGIASCVSIGVHLQREQGENGLWLALGATASLVLQVTLCDYFRGRFLRRSGSSHREGDDLEEAEADIAEGSPAAGLVYRPYTLFLRVQRFLGGPLPAAPPPHVGTEVELGAPVAHRDPAKIYEEQLAPIAQGWAWLGPSTHATLLLLFSFGHALSAYMWVRLTVGNLVMLALYVEQHRRERALAG